MKPRQKRRPWRAARNFKGKITNQYMDIYLVDQNGP
jgi:hypothetical protein